ncbi:hypothetical protein [Halarcobacter anaerophilus]|uniref:hypothetical protein n=1 Tax=Halarcobacter anaerophilus TaxID=877500 RepID=UPI0005C950D9|nr:hypothetical protein [Halarcobacter anaerophilus]
MFYKTFSRKKKNKTTLLEKEKELGKHKKISSMVNNLEGKFLNTKKEILKNKEFTNFLLDDDALIDFGEINEIIKSLN